MPHAIRLRVMALEASLAAIGPEAAMPGLFDHDGRSLRQVHLQQSVLEGMLALLLVAGAPHLDAVGLRSRAVPAARLATAIGPVLLRGLFRTFAHGTL